MKRKNTFLLISALLAAAVVSSVVLKTAFNRGGKVVVKQNGAEVYSGSLYKNKTVDLPGNTVVIKNGVVFMKNADCKNQLCVKQGRIKKTGESIICLPNRVTAEIK